MKSTTLPYWLALLVAVGAAYGGWKWWQVRKGHASFAAGTHAPDISEPLSEFELTKQSGAPFRSRDMLGKVWVASFFFAKCPGSCTKLNFNIRDMQQDPQLSGVHWVSITVDPVNDTLPALQQYADKFAADPERWHFCRGDFPYIRRVGKDIFKLYVGLQDHMDYGAVVDKGGNIRGWFDINSRTKREQMKKLLVKLSAEEVAAPPTDADEARR